MNHYVICYQTIFLQIIFALVQANHIEYKLEKVYFSNGPTEHKMYNQLVTMEKELDTYHIKVGENGQIRTVFTFKLVGLRNMIGDYAELVTENTMQIIRCKFKFISQLLELYRQYDLERDLHSAIYEYEILNFQKYAPGMGNFDDNFPTLYGLYIRNSQFVGQDDVIRFIIINVPNRNNNVVTEDVRLVFSTSDFYLSDTKQDFKVILVLKEFDYSVQYILQFKNQDAAEKFRYNFEADMDYSLALALNTNI